MFFNIGTRPNFNFPTQVQYGNLYVGLDPGWTIKDNVATKGLPDTYCKLIYCDNNIRIEFGDRRKFPIFYDNNNISNLIELDHEYKSGESKNFIKGSVTLDSNKEDVSFKKINLNDTDLFEYLYSYLDDKIKNFDTDLPINFFPTGGADVSMLISFVLKHKKKYNLLDSEYKAMDYFTCHNRNTVGRFWAYRDIHYWREPSILLSGTHGDEMMLRNPMHAYMLGKANGEDILQDLKNNDNYYHSHYYLRNKHQDSYRKADDLNLSLDNVRKFILENNAFDYQYWHMGETLTWTPLNDLKITNILLNFSYSEIKNQLLDAGITKKIICRNNPVHLKLMSKNKNVNHFNHLYKIFEGEETL